MTGQAKTGGSETTAAERIAGERKYLYYPGCSLHSTAEEFNDSAQALLRALGMEFEEISDWNCCGATPAHAASEFLTGALPLRNLVLAERQVQGWRREAAPGGGDETAGGAGAGTGAAASWPASGPVEVLVPCAACYNAFRLAEHEVREGTVQGEELNREIEAIVGRPFEGRVTVKGSRWPATTGVSWSGRRRL